MKSLYYDIQKWLNLCFLMELTFLPYEYFGLLIPLFTNSFANWDLSSGTRTHIPVYNNEILYSYSALTHLNGNPIGFTKIVNTLHTNW